MCTKNKNFKIYTQIIITKYSKQRKNKKNYIKKVNNKEKQAFYYD